MSVDPRRLHDRTPLPARARAGVQRVLGPGAQTPVVRAAGRRPRLELDFRVGGGERGEVASPHRLFRCRYHDIVPDERIVFAYDLELDRRLMSVSLTTVEFFADGDGHAAALHRAGRVLRRPDTPRPSASTGPASCSTRSGASSRGSRSDDVVRASLRVLLLEGADRAVRVRGAVRAGLRRRRGRPRAARRAVAGGEHPGAGRRRAGAPESTTIVEYVAPALVTGLQARLWDRVLDGQVATPMQKIVGDSLRPAASRTRRASSRRTPAGPRVRAAGRSADLRWLAGRRSPSRTARRPRRSSTPASCTAGTTRGLARLTDYFAALTCAPSWRG